MITWSDDANLDKICLDINKYISSYKMKNYFIYGLQGQERPHVRIAPKVTPVLTDLFKKSNYILDTKEVAERYCADCDMKHWHGECCCDNTKGCELCQEDNITIGIRRDIRSNVLMSRKLIKTIVFGLEDKLEVPAEAKLNLGRRVRKKVIWPKSDIVKKKTHALNALEECGCGTPRSCPNGNLDLSAASIANLPPVVGERVTQLAAELSDATTNANPTRMQRIIQQIQEVIGVR